MSFGSFCWKGVFGEERANSFLMCPLKKIQKSGTWVEIWKWHPPQKLRRKTMFLQNKKIEKGRALFFGSCNKQGVDFTFLSLLPVKWINKKNQTIPSTHGMSLLASLKARLNFYITVFQLFLWQGRRCSELFCFWLLNTDDACAAFLHSLLTPPLAWVARASLPSLLC